MAVNNSEERIVFTAFDRMSAVIKGIRGEVGAFQRTLASLGAVAGVGAFLKIEADVIKANAALVDLSAQTGSSIEGLSKLQQIGELGGNSFQDLAAQIGQMVKGLKSSGDEGTKASAALKSLGIDAKNTNGSFRDTSEIIFDLARALDQYRDDGNKVALVQDVLGKGAERFIPYLKDIVQFGDENARVTAEQAKQAKELEENLARLRVNAGEFGRTLAAEVTPRLSAFTEELLEAQKLSSSKIGFLGRLFSISGDEASDPVAALDQVNKKLETLKRLRAELDPGKSTRNKVNQFLFDDIGTLDQQIAYQTSRAEMLSGLARRRLGHLMDGLVQDASGEILPAPAKPSSGYQSPDLAAANREAKLYTSSLQGLEKQYFSLTHAGQVSVVEWETEQGSLKDLTEEHKKELLAVADKIDAYKRDIDLRSMVVRGVEAQVAAIGKARQITEDQVIADKERVEQLRSQSSLIGVSARDQEKLNALREIELDTRKRASQLVRDEDGNLLPGGDEALNRIRDQAEKQKKIVVDLIDARQKAERDWVTGSKDFFNQYADDATNAAKAAHDAFADAFGGMEDALVNFVKTGKLNFTALADSIVTDLARIAVRQSITGPLASSLASFIAGLGGNVDTGTQPPPGRAVGGPVSAGGLYLVGEKGPELFRPGSSGSIIPNDALRGDDPRISQKIDVHIYKPGASEDDIMRGVNAAIESNNARLMRSIRYNGAYGRAIRQQGK